MSAPRMSTREAMQLAPHETGHRAYECDDGSGDLWCIRCGDPWPCLPWRDAHTCKCSHVEALHHATRHGQVMCAPAACGCGEYRPAVATAMRRHPSGIPARFDERYDPSPEPIDRKTR